VNGLDVPSYAIEALKADAIEEAIRIFGPDSAVAELKAENAKLRKVLKYNGAVIEACTSEILDHVGVPYIVGPAGVAQALMEATAMLVHKRYGFDPPSFYKEDK
jgi:tagatose-1,6-bisphosphate aldolase